MEKNLFDKIADFIVKEVQENATDLSDGLNYTVEYLKIHASFELDIKAFVDAKIEEALSNKKEIADFIADTDGYDIVLWSEYAPNYRSEETE